MIKQKDVVQISEEIQRIVEGGADYIDAIIHYSDVTGMEVEVLAEVVKKSSFLSSRVQDEAEDLNMIEKTARLPV